MKGTARERERQTEKERERERERERYTHMYLLRTCITYKSGNLHAIHHSNYNIIPYYPVFAVHLLFSVC